MLSRGAPRYRSATAGAQPDTVRCTCSPDAADGTLHQALAEVDTTATDVSVSTWLCLAGV